MFLKSLTLLLTATLSWSVLAKNPPAYPGTLPTTPVELLPYQVAAAEILEKALQDTDRLSAWFELGLPENHETYSAFTIKKYQQMALLAAGEAVYHKGYGRYLILAMERAPANDATCKAYPGLVAQTYHQPMGDNWFRVGVRFCPYFFEKETQQERVETVVHELVHAVQGPGECLAYMLQFMAVALANNHYHMSPVMWDGHRCEEGGFFLPMGVDYTETYYRE